MWCNAKSAILVESETPVLTIKLFMNEVCVLRLDLVSIRN